jgi:hypothetical protein
MINISCHLFAFSWRILVILILCLGGFTAHFLANNLGYFMWEPVVEISGLDSDHGNHLDGTSLSINSDFSESFAGTQWFSEDFCVHEFLPPLCPQLPSPKFATTAKLLLTGNNFYFVTGM